MKKNYCAIFLLFLMLIINNPLKAQVSNYAFSQQTGQTYTRITGGTAISQGNPDDDSSYSNLPIGFTFNYNGSDYTEFGVSVNGFIGLGSSILEANLGNPLGNIANGRIISAFTFDLWKLATSDLMYKTEGTAPNRVLTIQFMNFTMYGNYSPILNFQIKLYETSNQIKICYGTMSNINNSYSPQVGISGNTNADFVCRTTSDNWTSTTNSTIAAYCTFNSSSYPPVGLIYTYATTPSLTTQAVSNIGAATATANGTITSLGRTNPSEYGVVWSTATNPTITLLTKTTQGAIAVTGAFTSNITGLAANTLYYVRPYATNDAGTGYGPEVSFTTLNFPLTITVPTLVSKVYDGTTDASSVTTIRTVSGKVSGDDVTVNLATSVFDNKNAGTGKTVTVTYSLSGADMAKYSAPAASVVATGVITARPVTVTADAGKTKVYGEGDPVFTYTVSPELIGSDNFTGALSRASGENVGSAYAINQGTLSAGTNYNITFISKDFNISRLDISGTFTAGNKTYNSNNTASITTRTLVGVLTADLANVSLSGGTATFSNALAGTGKVVTSAGMSLSGSAATNYNLTGVATTTANISTLNISGTFTAGNKTYDSNNTASITGRLLVGVLTADLANVSLNGGTATFSNALAGTGKVVTSSGMNLSGTAALNYNLTGVATTTANISTLNISGTFTAGNKSYDSNNTASITGRSLVGVLTADLANVNLSGGTATFSNALAGTGKVVTSAGMSLSGTAALNYNLTGVATTTANISTLNISGAFTAGNKSYDSNNTASITGRSLVGVLTADLANVSLTGGTTTFSNALAGTGKVVTSAGMSLSGTAALNYNLTGIATTTADINKAMLTVTTDAGQTKVYGEVDPAFTYTVSPALFIGDNFTGALSRAAGTNVGSYPTNSGTLNAGSNYNITFISKDFSITAKPITVTPNMGQSKVYGNVDPTFTYTVSEVPATGNGFTGTLSRATGENTGMYAIDLGTLSAGANYNISLVSKDFSITAKPITVTVNAGQTKVYGTVDPLFTYSVSESLATGNAFAGALTRIAGENVGLYAIGLGTLSAGGNYNINFVSKDFSITSRAVTVTSSTGQTKVYGDIDPVFSYTVEPALLGSDIFTGALSRSVGENVNTYAIGLGTLTNPNYDITFVSNNFSITSRQITVTATTGQTKVFGTVDPVFGYSVSETLLSDNSFTGMLSRTSGENVGSYGINIGTLSAGTNYNISFVSNDFSITTKPITVTANTGQTKVYGGADPILTYTYAPALIGSDTFTGTLTRVASENAGDHSIQMGTLSAGTNYTLNLVNQVFNISRLNISGTFTADNKTYDANNTATITSRSLTGVLTADLGNVSLIGGTATFSDKQVGTDIVVTLSGMSLSGTAALNYNLTGVATTTANISKLNISGAFTASSKTYDGNNTATITGSSLAGVPISDMGIVSLTGGTATFSNALAGTAKVVTSSGMSLSGPAASNYNLTGVATTVANINRAIIIVTAEEKTKVYGEADPVFTYTVAPALISTDHFTGALSRKNGEDVGSYAINAGTLNAGTNYTIAFVSLDLSITRRAITVTANTGQTKVYGAADPVFAFTVDPALVGSDSFTGALSRAAGENIGSAYAIGIGTLTNPNYNITFAGDNFSITAKPITVTANAGQTKVYSSVDPVYTYLVSPALIGSDAFTGALSRSSGENAGSYAINAGTLDAGTNYTISFAGNDFSITAKPVTVTADASKTKVYGSADPALTYTVSETLASGNNFIGALSRASGENVGSYAINTGTLSAGANYKINFVSNDFSITQKALSVNTPALTSSKTYNSSTAAIVTAGTLLGRITGDESKVNVSAVANYTNKNVGKGKTINVVYSISGSASSNYMKPIDYSVSTGEIVAKQLSISNTIITDNKMYDGNTTAVVESVGTLSGVEAVDATNVSITAVANYADEKVGVSKTITVVYTLGGSAIDNYIVPTNWLIITAKVSEKLVLNTLQSPTAGCEGSGMDLSYSFISGTPVQYQITFGAAALSAEFQNISFSDLTSPGTSNGTVSIPVPSGVPFGTYQASLQVRNELGLVSDSYSFQFVVNVSTDFIVTKFDDVVLFDNKTINFGSYQWYKNGKAINGATGQFYNDPLGLVGAYSLKLKTVGGQDLQTCSKVLNIPKAKKVSVSVYPNPMRANQESTVKITGLSDEELQGAVMNVYNIQGIRVYSTKTVEQINSLILQNLDGNYVGHITTAKGNDYVYRILLVK